MEYVEHTILRGLQYNDDFARKVMPHLTVDYFGSFEEKEYFTTIKNYFDKYNSFPTKNAMEIEFQSLKIGEDVFDKLANLSEELSKGTTKVETVQWLFDTTEQWCKEKALYNALNDAIAISQEEDNKNGLSKTSIPELLSSALAISFDSSIGHDYLEDSDERFDYYKQKKHKLPCHLDIFNLITQGGAERKTANCIAAGTGVGKSMLLCDLAAGYAKAGYNVVYITNEMAEEKISLRIDANLMNVDISKIEDMERGSWDKKISKVRSMMTGKIIVKEFPTSTAHVGHFQFLLRELEQKQNFVPDVLIIDYLNICASAKYTDKSNSYGYVKSICEELRGLAVKTNTVLWTATQLNRDGNDNTEPDLKNISESMGGPMTFDFLIALISNEELAERGEVMIKQLKNRYGDIFDHNKFAIGVDRPKMKFFDLSTPSINPSNAPVRSSSMPAAASGGILGTKPKSTNFSGIKP